jgi:hypothetical protein
VEQVALFQPDTDEAARGLEASVNRWLKRNSDNVEIISRHVFPSYSDIAHQWITIAIFYRRIRP